MTEVFGFGNAWKGTNLRSGFGGCWISRDRLFRRCIRAGHLHGLLRRVRRTRPLTGAQTSAGRPAPLAGSCLPALMQCALKARPGLSA
ncbi:MAG: hypothetical protein R6U40_11850 [Desulfobacterales bacterium]